MHVEFLVKLHLFKLFLLMLSLDDLILHYDLSAEVLFLDLPKGSNLHDLGFVASEGFTHGQLVLVTSRWGFILLNLRVAYSQLLAARRQSC